MLALRKRIHRSEGAPNIFAERLEAQIASKSEEQAMGRRRVLLMETAIVELGNYRSEVELISALEGAATPAA